MANMRAQLYFRLAVLMESGISITSAFEIISSDPSREARSFKDALSNLEKNGDLKNALETTNAFSFLEVTLAVVGEKSGTLPEIWRYLANYYEQRSKRRQQWLSRLYYPAFLLHCSIVVSHITIAVSAGIPAFFTAVLQTLLILYTIILVPIIVLWQLYKAEQIKHHMDNIVLRIPILNKWILYSQISYGFSIVHALYYSGIHITSAIEHAKRAVYFTPLKKAFAQVEKQIMKGESLEDAMKNERIFPRFVYESIVVGERSGKLDKTLEKVCQVAEEKSHHLFTIFLRITTGLIIGIVMLWVVFLILSGFMNYFDTLNSFIDATN